jgi:hypothetical protein
LRTDVHHRIERGHRILEDHGDLTAADLADLLGRHAEQVPAPEECFSSDHFPRRRLDQAENGQHRHALSASAFSDDPDRFPLLQREGDPIDGMDDPFGSFELRFKIANSQNRGGHTQPF